MRAPKTYFEQIPVETVKKIAKELDENNPIENDSVRVQAPDELTSPQERWRELAKRVQQEDDPNRMIRLVQELIATFDDEQRRKRLPPMRDTRNRSGSSEM
jgi:hypothetical protein